MQTPGPRPTGFANSLDPSSQFESERHRMALLCPGWKQRVDFEQESYQGESWCFNIFQCIYSIYIYIIQITDLYSTNRPCNVLNCPFGEVWVMLGNSRSFRATGIWILHLFLLYWWFDSSHVCHITKWCQIWSILIHSFHLLLILWVNMTTFENSPNHHGPEPLVILGNDYARSLGHTNSSAGEGQIGAYQTRMCTKTLG